jgi:hypothetical protein
MSALFGGSRSRSEPPAAPAVPAAPSIDVAAKAREEEDSSLRKKKRGRASTILNGNAGAGSPDTATKTLLGQ